LTYGSEIATMEYDGTNRRVSKTITHSGDWDAAYNFYYNGQSLIETRDNATTNEGSVLKQKVWGLGYIDELVQIGINQDPSNNLTTTNDENNCERFFWVCQDANYNVIGVVSAAGHLTERYEYTPYGQRTIFSRGWLLADIDQDGDVDMDDNSLALTTDAAEPLRDMNGDGTNGGVLDWNAMSSATFSAIAADDLVMHPRLESFRTPTADGTAAGTPGISLCDTGHQGLMHDKEFDLIYNRRRYIDPITGRFVGRDILEYVDGSNMYENRRSNPVGYVDWNGHKSVCSTNPVRPGAPSGSPKHPDNRRMNYRQKQVRAARLRHLGNWSIKRNKGEMRADAVSGRGDSIYTLARQTGLGTSKWRTWFIPSGKLRLVSGKTRVGVMDKLCPGPRKIFSVNFSGCHRRVSRSYGSCSDIVFRSASVRRSHAA